jgi:hypothetical protein
MKHILTIITTGLSLGSAVRADVEVTMTEVRRLGFLPQDKTDYHPEEKMDIKRRNPFAEKAKKLEAKSIENQTESEGSKIRSYLQKQKVSGIIKLNDKYIATVGRLVMEAGQTLPPLIPDQTQILRVMRVDKNTVELGWVEGSPYDTASPRKIVLKVDLTPRVEVQLVSSETDSKDTTKNTYMLDDTGKLYFPPRSDLMPDPSEIAENLPPGSDINPLGALNDEEKDQMHDMESAEDLNTPGMPPAPVSDGVPNTPSRLEQSERPEAHISASAVPQLPVEDEVLSDPDLAAPPPPAQDAGNKPAGPP